MRRDLCAAAAALAMAAATPALGDCKARMEAVASEYGTVSARETTFLNNEPALRDLRNAAVRLQAQKLESACEAVVEAMREAIAAYRAAAAPAAGAGTATTAATGEPAQPLKVKETGATQEAAPPRVAEPSREKPAGGDDVRSTFSREELEARLVPFTAPDMRRDTAEIEGTDIFTFDNQRLGRAKGLLLAQGRVTHLVLDPGGFWSFGKSTMAIPIDIVAWDPEWKSFVVPLTEALLEEAPRYEAGEEWTAEANDEFYAKLGG